MPFYKECRNEFPKAQQAEKDLLRLVLASTGVRMRPFLCPASRGPGRSEQPGRDSDSDTEASTESDRLCRNSELRSGCTDTSIHQEPRRTHSE